MKEGSRQERLTCGRCHASVEVGWKAAQIISMTGKGFVCDPCKRGISSTDPQAPGSSVGPKSRPK